MDSVSVFQIVLISSLYSGPLPSFFLPQAHLYYLIFHLLLIFLQQSLCLLSFNCLPKLPLECKSFFPCPLSSFEFKFVRGSPNSIECVFSQTFSSFLLFLPCYWGWRGRQSGRDFRGMDIHFCFKLRLLLWLNSQNIFILIFSLSSSLFFLFF